MSLFRVSSRSKPEEHEFIKTPCFTLNLAGVELAEVERLRRKAASASKNGITRPVESEFISIFESGAYCPEIDRYRLDNREHFEKIMQSSGMRKEVAYSTLTRKVGPCGLSLLLHEELDRTAAARAFFVHYQLAYYSERHRRQLVSYARDMPFWRFSSPRDCYTCDICQRLHGLIFHHKDPIWQQYLPPFHLCCRSSIHGFDSVMLEYDGLKVSDGWAVMRSLPKK